LWTRTVDGEKPFDKLILRSPRDSEIETLLLDLTDLYDEERRKEEKLNDMMNHRKSHRKEKEQIALTRMRRK
jgi:hypothetical protein